MRKYPIYLQDDLTSCGVYCLKMILKYYGIDEDIATMKRKARIDSTGTTIRGLVDTLQSYAIEAKAYHATLDDIEKHIQCPCILHTQSDEIGHFVVLYEIKGGTYIVGDPGNGLMLYEREEIEVLYSQNVISITHFGRYYDYGDKTYRSFLKETLKLYRNEVKSLIKLGLFSSLLGYGIAYLYQFMIDSLHASSPFFLFLLIALGYLIANLFKLLLSYIKEKKIILLTRSLDKEYVYTAIAHTLHLPDSFFYQDKAMIHSKLLDLYQLSHYSVEYFTTLFVDSLMIFLLFIGLVAISLPLAIIVAINLLLLFIYVKYQSRHLLSLYKEYIASHNKNASSLMDFLNHRSMGMRYLGKHRYLKRYERLYEEEESLKQDKEEGTLHLSQGIEAFSLLGSTGLLIIGFYLFSRGTLTMGQVFMCYMVQSLMIMPLLSLCGCVVEYPQNALLYERFKEFEQEEEEGNQRLEAPIVSIKINNLSFAYGFHEEVLSHLDLTIDHTVFIIGDNGSGKSTFLKLLMGSDKHYKGDILINGLSLKDMRIDSLHEHIGYVALDEGFINGTVFENLMCQDTVRIREILSLLDADDLVSLFNITMQPLGQPLSLGQRQLLCLARALLKDYDVYLLDEAFNHLSLERASSLLSILKNHYPDKIFVIVTHQTNLVNTNDEYVIIEGGKIRHKG